MSNEEAIRICEGCGARNAAEAQFCGICGREFLEASAPGGNLIFQDSPNAHAWQDAEPVMTPHALEDERVGNNLGEVETTAQPSSEDGMQKRCSWCGALNPWVAAVCEACEARFPVPGQDEAFRQAAEERLRQEEANLNFLRQKRRRFGRGFWR